MGVSAWLLARAAEHPPVLYLLVAATAVRTFGTSRGVLRYAERLLSHDVALRMQSSLRLRVYDRLARTTLLGTRRGDLLMRVTADVEAIMDVIVRVGLPFASASVVLLGTCFVVMFLDVPTAISLLACSVIAGIVLPILAQRLSARADAAAVPARSDLAQVVHASARAATDVVAYGRVEQQLQTMAAADARLRAAESRAAWTRGLATGSQVVVMGIAVAAALVLGGRAVVAGDMLAPSLAAVALLPLALNESFGDLAKAAQTMTHASAALRRVVELLTAAPVGSGDRVIVQPSPTQERAGGAVRWTPAIAGSQTSPSSRPIVGGYAGRATPEPASPLRRSVQHGATRPPAEPAPGALAPEPVLQLTDVTIGWPDNPDLVSGLDLTVQPGQAVAVTGASGIGKTTLAATVLGLIPARGGDIDVTPSVGYLAQDAHIFTTTVSENVRIGNPRATDEEVAEALRHAGLPYLDPERLVGEDGATLSGGEARRVALARLLVISPRPALTLLDEPTEHLDAETARELMDDIWANTLPDGALLVLTHDPGVVARCDRSIDLG